MDTPLLSDLQMFQNEKFFLNLTQVLNISADNLTNLLQGLEPQDLLEQAKPTMAMQTHPHVSGDVGNKCVCKGRCHGHAPFVRLADVSK